MLRPFGKMWSILGVRRGSVDWSPQKRSPHYTRPNLGLTFLSLEPYESDAQKEMEVNVIHANHSPCFSPC